MTHCGDDPRPLEERWQPGSRHPILRSQHRHVRVLRVRRTFDHALLEVRWDEPRCVQTRGIRTAEETTAHTRALVRRLAQRQGLREAVDTPAGLCARAARAVQKATWLQLYERELLPRARLAAHPGRLVAEEKDAVYCECLRGCRLGHRLGFISEDCSAARVRRQARCAPDGHWPGGRDRGLRAAAVTVFAGVAPWLRLPSRAFPLSNEKPRFVRSEESRFAAAEHRHQCAEAS